MRMFMATWPIGLLIALLSACATTREARLYDALGGEAGVAKLVDAITAEYREDTKIGFLFQDTYQDYFRARLRDRRAESSARSPRADARRGHPPVAEAFGRRYSGTDCAIVVLAMPRRVSPSSAPTTESTASERKLSSDSGLFASGQRPNAAAWHQPSAFGIGTMSRRRPSQCAACRTMSASVTTSGPPSS